VFDEIAAKVLTLGPSGLVPWPVRHSYLRHVYGRDWLPGFLGSPRNFEEAVLSRMPLPAYKTLIEPYTQKQWGLPGRALRTSLARRVPVRADDDERLTPQCKYQGVPRDGYHALFQRMLEGITVYMNCELATRECIARARRLLVFTGSIDEFFTFDLGRLGYRAQERRTVFLPGASLVQPCVQINNPLRSHGDHIRTIEWKHLIPAGKTERIVGSLCTRETPYTATTSLEYEYPFPDDTNSRRYRAYRARAKALDGVIICGRLGEYRYLDMDKAVENALRIADSIVRVRGRSPNRDRPSGVLH